VKLEEVYALQKTEEMGEKETLAVAQVSVRKAGF
jgi:hypothetical protein